MEAATGILLGFVIAAVIAIIAFLALSPPRDESPRDNSPQTVVVQEQPSRDWWYWNNWRRWDNWGHRGGYYPMQPRIPYHSPHYGPPPMRPGFGPHHGGPPPMHMPPMHGPPPMPAPAMPHPPLGARPDRTATVYIGAPVPRGGGPRR